MDQLGEDEPEVADEEEDKEEDEMDPPPSKIQNFKEAVQSLEDVQQFLEGYIEEALEIGSAINTMTILKIKSSKQTILYMATVLDIVIMYYTLL